MKYRIDTTYCWYNKGSQLVKMYFINSIPFTFDELSEDSIYNFDILEVANNERNYEPEDLYRSSFYLIDEEAHPCLFYLDLENPEDMPDDSFNEY